MVISYSWWSRVDFARQANYFANSCKSAVKVMIRFNDIILGLRKGVKSFVTVAKPHEIMHKFLEAQPAELCNIENLNL